jgi:hypothetical protein
LNNLAGVIENPEPTLQNLVNNEESATLENPAALEREPHSRFIQFQYLIS